MESVRHAPPSSTVNKQACIDDLLVSFFVCYMSLTGIIMFAFSHNNTEKVSPLKAQCLSIITYLVLASVILSNGILSNFKSLTGRTYHTIVRAICHFLPPLTIASLFLIFSLPVVNLEWIGFLVVCVIAGIEYLYLYNACKKNILNGSMITTRATDYTVVCAAVVIIFSLLVPVYLVNYKLIKWSIVSVSILMSIVYNFNVYWRTRKGKCA